MNIDTAFQLTKFRASKSGFSGTISSADFNLVFPQAGLRYFLKLYGNQNQYQVNNPVPPISYPGTIKVSTSLSKFGTTPYIINIDASGKWYKPSPDTDFFIDSLAHYLVGVNGSSILAYTITPGTGYTNGFYPDTVLTGGTGSGARANITVAGNSVTTMALTSIGTGYAIADSLTAAIPGSNDFAIVVTSLTQDTPTPIKRVEKQDEADNLFSYYEFPNETFPIYIEYANYIQFYPADLGTARLTTLRKPVTPVWGFTLAGTIVLTNTLVAGSGYTNGVYPNIVFTGGNGNSSVGNVTVSGGVVTNVAIVDGGFAYKVGDTLTGTIPGGTGWSFNVATITNAREVYNSATSVDPEWADYDVDEVIYRTLSDMGIYLKDGDLEQFAVINSKTGGVE